MSKSKNAQKRYAVFFVMLVAVFSFLLADHFAPNHAHADMGPKPSVTVDFENLPDERCYGTLLSAYANYGPHAAYDGQSNWQNDYFIEHLSEEEVAIWRKLVDYKDSDGYYFLQVFSQCRNGKDNGIYWGYYPPSPFKILLYFPERDAFVSSGIYERYAFHSYFSVNVSSDDIDVTASTPQITARRSYDYTWEIISLIVRIIATVLIELGVAWLFKLRKKYQILTILTVNVITQIALNVTLYLVNYYNGGFSMFITLFILEAFVFFIEMLIYPVIFVPREKPGACALYGDGSEKALTASVCVEYAISANLASLLLGVGLWEIMPGMF